MNPVAPVTKYVIPPTLPLLPRHPAPERPAVQGNPTCARSGRRQTPAPAPPRPSPPAKRAAPATASAKTCGPGLRLEREGLVERQAEALDRGARGRRASSPAGSSPGPRRSPARARGARPAGTTSVSRPIASASVGLDDAAGEDQVERAPEPDDPRQPLRAAVDQRHAPAALGEAERRALGGDAQVAPQRELQSARQAPARDRGDRRLASASSRVKPNGPSAASRRPANVAIAFRSAPAQKLTPPAPVTTSTRASSSASNARKPSSSRSAVGPSTALRRSGRSIVRTAAAPLRS